MDRYEMGQRIAGLRRRAGESQEDLAASLGEIREVVKHWENGTRQLKAEAIIKLARHFDVPADYLLGLRDGESTDITIQAVTDFVGLSEKSVIVLNYLSTRGNCDAWKSINRRTLSFIDRVLEVAFPQIDGSSDDDIKPIFTFFTKLEDYIESSSEDELAAIEYGSSSTIYSAAQVKEAVLLFELKKMLDNLRRLNDGE